MSYESVRLFLERVRTIPDRLGQHGKLSLGRRRNVHQLDGIPLALEMAATRMSAMTAEEIATQLTHVLGARFRLLTSGARTAPLRQRTLLATLDWSYALLEPAEQRLLRRASARLCRWLDGTPQWPAVPVCSDAGMSISCPMTFCRRCSHWCRSHS